MRLAIMQPYVFPYLGYFQLINAVEKFVVYDDVAFIKQGWINRNNILLNGKSHLFSLPIKNMSSYAAINETFVSEKPFNWDKKLMATFTLAYKKAPYFDKVFPLIESVLIESPGKPISIIATESIKMVISFLGIEKSIIDSSVEYNNKDLKASDRVIDICKRENACTYINTFAGEKIYRKENFEPANIKLKFIKPVLSSYKQFNETFVSGLSVIDVMMFCSIPEIVTMLNQYDFV